MYVFPTSSFPYSYRCKMIAATHSMSTSRYRCSLIGACSHTWMVDDRMASRSIWLETSAHRVFSAQMEVRGQRAIGVDRSVQALLDSDLPFKPGVASESSQNPSIAPERFFLPLHPMPIPPRKNGRSGGMMLPFLARAQALRGLTVV
jgi:hypothetical protein